MCILCISLIIFFRFLKSVKSNKYLTRFSLKELNTEVGHSYQRKREFWTKIRSASWSQRKRNNNKPLLMTELTILQIHYYSLLLTTISHSAHASDDHSILFTHHIWICTKITLIDVRYSLDTVTDGNWWEELSFLCPWETPDYLLVESNKATIPNSSGG